jgi:hypothetical protein
MRALGFTAWHRQTMGNVERGERRLLAEELHGLSRALGISLQALIAPSPEDKTVEFPSGESIAVASVQQSAAGIPDDAVSWDGNVPVLTEPGQLAVDVAALGRLGIPIDAATITALDRAAAAVAKGRLSARQAEEEPDGPPGAG